MSADMMHIVLAACSILIIIVMWYCFVTCPLLGYWTESDLAVAKMSTTKQQHNCGHVVIVVTDADGQDSTNTCIQNALICENELLDMLKIIH